MSLMMTRAATARINRLICLPVTFALLVGIASSGSQAALLVGTIVTSGTETIAEINQLIADYNADFGASLPSATQLLDKIEGQNSANFELGNLQLGDFNFYQQDNDGATNLNIFDATVKFSPSTLGPAAGFDTLDQNVFAFEQLSGPSFYYYVSKDGNLGWSLWAAGSGLNPVYTDAGVGASSIVGSDFTRGPTTNPLLAYDPIKSGVSHISFYGAPPGTGVPEPTTGVLLCAMLTGLYGCARHRRRSAS